LPTELGNLKQLRVLDVSGNRSAFAVTNSGSVQAPERNTPLIRFLISPLQISFACIYHMLSQLSFFSSLLHAYLFAFSALTLLVGQQEGHPACKN